MAPCDAWPKGRPAGRGVAERVSGRGPPAGRGLVPGTEDGHGGGRHRPAVHDRSGIRDRSLYRQEGPAFDAATAAMPCQVEPVPRLTPRHGEADDDLCASTESFSAGATKTGFSWLRCRVAGLHRARGRPGDRVADLEYQGRPVRSDGEGLGRRGSGQDIGSHALCSSANSEGRRTKGRSQGQQFGAPVPAESRSARSGVPGRGC